MKRKNLGQNPTETPSQEKQREMKDKKKKKEKKKKTENLRKHIGNLPEFHALWLWTRVCPLLFQGHIAHTRIDDRPPCDYKHAVQLNQCRQMCETSLQGYFA